LNWTTSTFASSTFYRRTAGFPSGEFIKKITSFPEVVEFHVIGGERDFMIKVIVPDMTAYRRFFVQKLGEVPNVARLQSIIVLDTGRTNRFEELTAQRINIVEPDGRLDQPLIETLNDRGEVVSSRTLDKR
jgi:hypothetical protein